MGAIGSLELQPLVKRCEHTLSKEAVAESVDVLVKNALQIAVADGLCRRKEKLHHIGALDTCDDGEIRRRTATAFDTFFYNYDNHQSEAIINYYYARVAELIVLSGVGWANVLGDWSVNREDTEAAQMLQLKSFNSFECLLGNKYGNPADGHHQMRHLHQGSGDNGSVHRLNNESDHMLFVGSAQPAMRNQVFDEIGMGDKLCFSVERIVSQFIRPDLNGTDSLVAQQVVRVLTEALQNKLDERWSDEGEENEATDVRDLNVIFELLANPAELLEDVHLARSAEFKLSSEYKADQTVGVLDLHERDEVSLETHKWLLQYTGTETSEARRQIREHEMSICMRLEQSLNRLEKDIQKYIRRSNRGVKSGVSPVASADQLQQYHALTGESLAADTGTRDLLEEIQRQKLERETRRLGLWLHQLPGGDAVPNEVMAFIRKHDLAPHSFPKTGTTVADVRKLFTVAEQNTEAILHMLFGQQSDVLMGSRMSKFFTQDFVSSVIKSNLYAADSYAHYRKSDDYRANITKWIDPTTELHNPKLQANVPEAATIKIDGQYVAWKDVQAGEEYSDPRGFRVVHRSEAKGRPQPLEIHFEAHCTEQFSLEVVSMLDLNKKPETHLHNFVPGDFANVSDMFPHASFIFISGIRSHSHMSDDDFIKLLEDNLLVLQPGGVLLTDGINASHSRILRLAEGLAGYKVEIVMDGSNHKPAALMIQRAHPRGYLTDEEKQQQFLKGAYFKSPSTLVEKRPDVRIIDAARRNIIPFFSNVNSVEAARVHTQLDDNADRQLRYMAASRAVRDDEGNLADETLANTLAYVQRRIEQKRATAKQKYGKTTSEKIQMATSAYAVRQPTHLDEWLRIALGGQALPEVIEMYQRVAQAVDWTLGGADLSTDIKDHIEQQMQLAVDKELEQFFQPAEELSSTIATLGVAGQTFYETRAELMQICGAKEQEGVRNFYERALFDAMAAAIFEKWLNGTLDVEPSPDNQDDEDGSTPAHKIFTKRKRQEVIEYLLGLAKNTDYEDDPFLSDGDLAAVQARVMDDLQVTMTQEQAVDGPLVSGDTIERFNTKKLHGFRRITADRNADTNHHCELDVNQLHQNMQFFGEQARVRYERKCEHLTDRLQHLRGTLGLPPLQIISFTDCKTNVQLRDVIADMLGDQYESLVQEMNIDFRGSDDTPSIAHFNQQVAPKLEKRLQHGGIVIMGGSWWDAFDTHGDLFKEHVATPLLDTLIANRSPLKNFNICYGQQVMGDLVSQRLCDGDIVTKSGLLEFGPTPIKVDSKAQHHPLFVDCPREMTLAMTHSGHLHGPTFNPRNPHMKPLAWSQLTNLPVAWSALGDRLLNVQFHPELDIIHPEMHSRDDLPLAEGIIDVMNQVGTMSDSIQQNYGIKTRQLWENWNKAKQRLAANGGREVLVNGLLHLAS